MNLSDYAILVRGVTKRYPKVKRYREMLLHPFSREEVSALHGVDLEVNKGELFGLLGPNGAGKTSLIKILCTLVHPNEGNAWVNGYSTVGDSWKVRCSIGYVINEERSFYWRLTGRQNLEFFAVLYNLNKAEAQKRIDYLFDLTGLTEAKERMFKDYSTGMRQKMAIMRGLLTDPSVLFMDEPTRSLDPIVANDLRAFILQEIVGRQKRTVFFSTHNLQEAEICQRIAILDEGRIKICGVPAQIKERYSSPRYWLKLRLDDRVRLEEMLRAFPGVKEVLLREERPPSAVWEVELASHGEDVSELIKTLVQGRVAVEGCYPRRVTLEDIFQRFTTSKEHKITAYSYAER